MSDPLWDFLMTRDRDKVLAEARPCSVERLYAEASIEDRGVLEVLSPGQLRRRVAVIEQEQRTPKVRVIGNKDLMRVAKLQMQRADTAEAKNKELRALIGASVERMTG